MIADQIESLIEQVKQHKNGETRNSLLGRLKDARAHAIVLEREEFIAGSPEAAVLDQFMKLGNGQCICPAPGVTAKDCPIHKSQFFRYHKLNGSWTESDKPRTGQGRR